MKVKLLRKVRKRYEILWYPKGTVSGKKPFYLLRDKDSYNSLLDGYFNEKYFVIGEDYQDAESALKAAKGHLLKWILSTYKEYGKRRNNLHKPIKVWHVHLNSIGKK